MHKHPNEFTRRQISRYFSTRYLDAEVNNIQSGYVIFIHHFSAIEACTVDEAAARLIFDTEQGKWSVYWMSGRFRWHLYDRYDRLDQALDLMFSEKASSLFHNVL